MKLLNISIYILVFLGITQKTIAQAESSYSLYNYNTTFYNPAALGIEKTTIIKSNFRSQFTSIDEAPETQSLSLSIPINKKISMGGLLISDRVFIERANSFFISFSYKLQLSRTTDLYFGIQAGGTSVAINFERLNLPSDPLLSQNANYFNPNLGLGFYLKDENYFVSVSAPRLFKTDRVADENGVVTVANNAMLIHLNGSYNFNINDKISFKPSTLVRFSNEETITDLTGTFSFFDKFDIGANYRIDRAAGGLIYIRIKKHLEFGYAFETNISNINNYENGTHEFGITFRF